MATSSKSSNKKVQGLAKKLADTAKKAKGLGINTAKSDAMVAQTKAEGSKRYKGSSYDKGQQDVSPSLSATNIGVRSPVIPPAPQPNDVGDMLGANNASVLQQGLTLDGGQFVKDPTASDQMNAAKEANMNMGNIANTMLGYLNPQDNQYKNAYEDTYGISERQAGRDMRRAEQEVQQYTSQLNSITASRDASVLSLEGTGRGQSTGFIGGEQARINREAAIQALPVQAQLAAAQGNLEIAKSHVDTLFQMKIKDIETEQAYKQTVANTWMSVANTQQSNLLNAAIADSNARAEAKKTAMNDAKQIAMQAIEYGQSSLAASVMKLDPTSATYQQDVMNAVGGLRKPVAAPTGDGAPKVVSVNGVDSVWNPTTSQFEAITVGGGDGTNLKPVKDIEIRDLNDTWTAKNSIVSIVDDMTKSIQDNGTKIFWGTEAGKRGANKTNLLLAMKNLEKTGALDKGTIDVLADLIPENDFWATEDRQIGALNQLKDTITSKTDEFVGSYRGTTAETDPRTQRIYSSNTPTIDVSLFQKDDINDVYSLFGITSSSTSFNADDWLK